MGGNARIALGAIVLVVGLFLIDSGLYSKMSIKNPAFTFVQGKSDITYVVFDGFLGHPEKRMAEVMSAFGEHSILFVNPHGNRFDLEAAVSHTVSELRRRGVSHVVPVGKSLGAKVAYRLTQVLHALPYEFAVTDLKLVDPVFDGRGLRDQFGAKVLASLKPGPILNLLSPLLTKVLIRSVTNEHQAYGRNVKLSRMADEARESAGPAVTGSLLRTIRVTIIHCDPAEDEVLAGHVKVWQTELISQGHKVTVVPVPRGTHHMGIDTEPNIWLTPLVDGLSV